MENETFKCYTCSHYNYKANKCYITGCNIIGNEEEIYKLYEEANPTEMYRREIYYKDKAKREKKNTIEDYTAIAELAVLVICTIIFCVFGLTGLVLYTIQMFSHPEMTRTELLIWEYTQHPIINFGCVGSIIIGYIAYHLLTK